MKKIVIVAFSSLLIIMIVNYSIAQTLSDNFTNPSQWTFVPASGSSNSCASPSGNSIVMNGSTYPGKCAFYQMNGSAGSDCRVYRPLGFYLSNTWTTQFDFELTSYSGVGVAVYPIVFTAGTQEPTVNDATAIQTNQDAMGIICVNTNSVLTPVWLAVWTKVGTSVSMQYCDVDINTNIPYRIIWKRVSKTQGSFSVYYITSGGATGAIVQPSCCFPIPSSIPDLGYVQISNATDGSSARNGNGWVTNLSVTNTDILPCCNATDITCREDIPICSQTTSATYCVNNSVQSGTAFNWIVPNGITYTVIDSGACIHVTNWGSNTGLIPISVSWECNCTTDTLTREIPVHTSLNGYSGFNIDTSTAGSNLTISCTPSAALPSGVSETWKIYQAANCIIGDTTTTGTALNTATTTTFVTTNLPAGNCYVIIRTLMYSDGTCPPIIQIGKAGKGLSTSLISFPDNDKSEPKIYPNPTLDIVTIEIPANSNRIKNICVVDVLGNTVISEDVNKRNKILFSTKDLSAGIYSVKFVGDNYTKSVKLVKN